MRSSTTIKKRKLYTCILGLHRTGFLVQMHKDAIKQERDRKLKKAIEEFSQKHSDDLPGICAAMGLSVAEYLGCLKAACEYKR